MKETLGQNGQKLRKELLTFSCKLATETADFLARKKNIDLTKAIISRLSYLQKKLSKKLLNVTEKKNNYIYTNQDILEIADLVREQIAFMEPENCNISTSEINKLIEKVVFQSFDRIKTMRKIFDIASVASLSISVLLSTCIENYGNLSLSLLLFSLIRDSKIYNQDFDNFLQEHEVQFKSNKNDHKKNIKNIELKINISNSVLLIILVLCTVMYDFKQKNKVEENFIPTPAPASCFDKKAKQEGLELVSLIAPLFPKDLLSNAENYVIPSSQFCKKVETAKLFLELQETAEDNQKLHAQLIMYFLASKEPLSETFIKKSSDTLQKLTDNFNLLELRLNNFMLFELFFTLTLLLKALLIISNLGSTFIKASALRKDIPEYNLINDQKTIQAIEELCNILQNELKTKSKAQSFESVYERIVQKLRVLQQNTGNVNFKNAISSALNSIFVLKKRREDIYTGDDTNKPGSRDERIAQYKKSKNEVSGQPQTTIKEAKKPITEKKTQEQIKQKQIGSIHFTTGLNKNDFLKYLNKVGFQLIEGRGAGSHTRLKHTDIHGDTFITIANRTEFPPALIKKTLFFKANKGRAGSNMNPKHVYATYIKYVLKNEPQAVTKFGEIFDEEYDPKQV